MVGSALCFLFSFLFVQPPILLARPHKFALAFTLGSLLFMIGYVMRRLSHVEERSSLTTTCLTQIRCLDGSSCAHTTPDEPRATAVFSSVRGKWLAVHTYTRTHLQLHDVHGAHALLRTGCSKAIADGAICDHADRMPTHISRQLLPWRRYDAAIRRHTHRKRKHEHTTYIDVRVTAEGAAARVGP